MKILRSAVAVAALTLLFAPARAQTFVARTNATGTGASGAAAPDGRTAVAWNEAPLARAVVFGPSGALEHSLRLQAPVGSQVRVWGLGFSPAGELIVLGEIDALPWICAVDPATGIVAWDHTAGTQEGHFQSVTALTGGHLLACGYAKWGGTPHTFLMLVSPGGELLWQSFHSDVNSPDSYDWGYDVAPATDGGAWLTLLKDSKLRVRRIGVASASILWEKVYVVGGGLYETKVRPTPDGGLIVAGVTEPVDNHYRVAAMKLSGTGAVEWARGYASFDASIWDVGFLNVGGVVTTPEGYAIAVSQIVAEPAENRDVALLHLDLQGSPIAYRNVGVPGHGEEALALERLGGGSLLCATWVQGQGPRVMRLAASGASGLACAPETPLPVFAYALNVTAEIPDVWWWMPVAPTAFPKHAPALLSSAVGWLECQGACAVTPIPFGVGLAGSGGLVPQISGTGGPCLAGGVAIHVAKGLGGTVGALALSLGKASLPVLGGWIWLDPSGAVTVPLALTGALGAPGAGGATFPITADLSVLIGAQVHAQAFLFDPGAAKGIAMTRGLTLDVN